MKEIVKVVFRVFEKGYINLVPVVANFQVPVDAQLIDVGDLCHVPHTFIGRFGGAVAHLAWCLWLLLDTTWNTDETREETIFSIITLLVLI